MSAKSNKNKEIAFTELSDIAGLDLSMGFTCDMETGICGPTEKKEESVEENTHADNDMV